MRLRQKKTNNPSQDAFCQGFQVVISNYQNQHFQSPNRKQDLVRRVNNDSSKVPSFTGSTINTYAQILARFLANSNLAKQATQNKTQYKPSFKNVSSGQSCVLSRIGRMSGKKCFDYQNNIENPKIDVPHLDSPQIKRKVQEQRDSSPSSFSISKKSQAQPEIPNLRKQLPEQNIINNLPVSNSLNMSQHARFMQPQYFGFNPQMMNSWFQINPFFKPYLQNFVYLPEQMKNGLYRQLQIYEKFKHQTTPQQIQKKPLPFTAQNENEEQKKQQKQSSPVTNKMSPNKIFKRASYHVGIAYSIYMDSIQKEGKPINNFSEIDPTRFARKYKNSQKQH